MWAKWWFWSSAKRAGVHSSPLIITAGTLLCLNPNRRDSPVENELNYLLGSNTPSKSRLEKMPVAAGMLQTEHFNVQAPEPGSVLCIGLARLKCKTFKSWLQPVLKCVNFSCFWQELNIQNQRQDFHWKHWKCVYCWQWKGFLHPFSHERGGGWTTVEGNGARRKSCLGLFLFLPSWWFRAVVN